MSARILVIEDDEAILKFLRRGLAYEGYQVDIATDGQMGLGLARDNPPDLVVLDLMLPGVDGFEITRHLRQQGDTPIIMLTARRAETDRIAGLEMGADDYVVKPFSPQELVSRVRAVLRRTRGQPQISQGESLEFDDLRINPVTRLVEVNSQEIQLTAKEFDLLLFMAKHKRQVFNRDQLLDHVWGLADYIDPSTVTVHVRRLREKVEVDPSTPRHIITVWGVGYKFEP